MCIVVMCLGLRVSEILGLRWHDIDWEGLRLAVLDKIYVYGIQGDVKTQASHRWMPLDRSLAEKLRQHKAQLAPLAKSEHGYSPTRKQESRIGQVEFRRRSSLLKKAGIGWIG